MPKWSVHIDAGDYYDIEADNARAAEEEALQQHVDMACATVELQAEDDEEEDDVDDDEI